MVDYAAKAGSNLSKDPFLLSSKKRLSYEMMRNAGLTGATKLATTSVAVFLVAAFTAVYSTAPPEIIVSVVAAYAAVLVVFVGANQ